eukprot:CAMPEP_0182426176 /NCGR_PEP_ID=MMETSP1167-20130531/12586_1 /TAXON_ID=2988 /ORGANISM="Mallomonas Sp, Strain CCMP3275" /LENGTH=424 /DNA_ID=CAMNT_0024607425 /DNA_START=110 /DNA_END=1384 /DNA_ORIENTATION=-
MGKKGGKKGKKGKKKEGPEITTTQEILSEREKMLCPRMGDAYTRTMNVEFILEGVVTQTMQKCAEKQQEVLNLSNMKIHAMPLEIANSPELQCITDINLSKNQLFNGDTVFQAISHLGGLRRLNLTENCLNGPLSPLAGELINLEVLRLDMNHITELPGSVRNWSNLRVLTLSDNKIPVLPFEAGYWSQLNYLNLRGNQLTDLSPSHLGAWTLLERLYLGINKMKSLPDEIGMCTQLRELDLSANLLETIPSGLSSCTLLQQLHLGANKISEIPSEVLFTLVNLRELQLYKNRITTIPPEIGNLSEITRLSLSSNNIRSLPEEIGACTQLTELYLNNNAKFSILPSTTGHLRFLQELSMRKCPALKILPATALEMTSLRELDIRAAKKQVCKIAPEVAQTLRERACIVRGGVVKKAKKKSKKAK